MRACLFLFAAQLAWAQADLIEGGTWSYTRAQDLRRIPAEGQPGGFTEALQAATTAPNPAMPWSSQLSLTVRPATRAGQWLRFRLWARSPNRSRAGFIHELNRDPFNKALELQVRLAPEWREYAFAYQAVAFAEGGSALRIRTGFDAGVVELAGLRLEDHSAAAQPPPSIGIDYFGGQLVDDSWREAAQERIRRHRMADLRVVVIDAQDRPVPGAVVEVEQLRHAFPFGSALADGPLLAATPDGDRYRAEFLRLFNYGVHENALKWQFRNGDGYPIAARMLDWTEQNGIPMRGHNLLWPSYRYLPASVAALRGQELRDAVERHIRDYATRARGRVVVWDVINEAYTNTEVFRDAGRDLLWLAFQWARESDPGVGLVYNDYNLSNNRDGANDTHRQGAYAVIRELLDHDAPVDILGDQGHMGVPLTPIPRVLEIWDEMSAFGKPIEVTEFDINLGSQPDEQAQARYLADYMTAAFSHPNIRSLVFWGFWDGAHWLASAGAGLYRRDWTARPMLDAYENLVLNEWWTRAKGEAGEAGDWSGRVFLGKHRVKALVGDASVEAEVTVGAEGREVTLRLP